MCRCSACQTGTRTLTITPNAIFHPSTHSRAPHQLDGWHESLPRVPGRTGTTLTRWCEDVFGKLVSVERLARWCLARWGLTRGSLQERWGSVPAHRHHLGRVNAALYRPEASRPARSRLGPRPSYTLWTLGLKWTTLCKVTPAMATRGNIPRYTGLYPRSGSREGACRNGFRKEDTRLPGRGNSNSRGARPVY